VKLAYTHEFVTEPIARALERRGWVTIPTLDPCDLLNSGQADIALAPTVDYARCLGLYDYALVLGAGIMTQGFAGLIRLAFNRGLVNLETMTTKQPNASATLAARFVLAEKYDLEPRLVEVPGEMGVDEMLAQSDAALLIGDDAIFQGSNLRSMMDISDEWEDVTETSLPYMLAWGRVGVVDQEMIDEEIAARDEAVLTLADHVAQHSQAAQANAMYQSYLRGDIRFTIEPHDVEALELFFRYAFYHATISDIPAIKLLPDGEAVTPVAPN
jgi:predicted solute-binding protein